MANKKGLLQKIYEPIKWFGGEIKKKIQEQIRKENEFFRKTVSPSKDILEFWKKRK